MRNEYGFPVTRERKTHPILWFNAGLIVGAIVILILIGAI